MKVYVVLAINDQYGFETLKAVFSTKEKAEEYCKNEYHSYVKEVEVDALPK